MIKTTPQPDRTAELEAALKVAKLNNSAIVEITERANEKAEQRLR